MPKRQRYALVLILVALSVHCASVAGGDPAVVRAEDLLTNSLTIYSQAMSFHFTNSTKESPAVYKAFESFRVKFPIAWTALDNAKRAYVKDKSLGTGQIAAAASALSTLVSAITPLIGGT